MIDIFIDDVKCTEIRNVKEGFEVVLKNQKDESLHLVLDEESFVDLFGRMFRRCESQNLIPIHNR